MIDTEFRRKFIENFIYVQNKQSQLVLLKYNAVQRFLHEHETQRDIYLKFRQAGVSVWKLAEYFTDAITTPNTTTAIVSHEDKFTQKLLERIRVMYKNLPDPKPEIYHNSTHMMSFPDLGSSIYIGTAGAKLSWGSGDTIHRLHLCLHPDNLVLTSAGIPKRIADLTIGERVYTAKHGHLMRVSALSKTPCNKPMVQVHTWHNSAPLLLTTDHKVLADSHAPYWKAAGELIPTKDRKGCQKRKHGMRKGVDHILSPIRALRNTKPAPDIDGFIVGLFLAEGSYSTNAYNTTYPIFSLHAKEEELAEHIKRATSKHCGDRIRPGSLARTISVYDNAMGQKLLELIGQDKYIPDSFWDYPAEWLERVIEGYQAGDGHFDGKTWVIPSVRPSLVFQLRELLLSLGKGYSAIDYAERSDPRGWNVQPIWHIRYPLEGRYWHYTTVRCVRHVAVYVKSVVPIESSTHMYDIEVAGGHSFQTPCGMVHNSEMGKWTRSTEEIAQFMASCREAVPKEGCLTIESTPCGDTGYFFDMVQDVIGGKSAWALHTVPWWWAEDYYLLPGDPLLDNFPDWQYEFEPTVEENDLILAHNLTLDQIRWRRWKQTPGECGDLFLQEYIEDEVSCFLGGEGMVFDKSRIDALYRNRHEPIAKLTMPGDCELLIWRYPQPEDYYVGGLDPAEAEYTHDKSALNIVSGLMQTKVASIHGHYDQPNLAAATAAAGDMYNKAFMVIENNKGRALISTLMGTHRYRSVYHQEGVGNRTTKTPGYNNHPSRREALIANHKNWINSGEYTTYDAAEIREMRNFIKLDGKAQARPGSMDDTILAGALSRIGIPVAQKRKTQNRYQGPSKSRWG